MSHFKTISLAAIVSSFVVIPFGTSTPAQSRVYHPGQKLVLTISFDGPTAAKVSCATFNFSMQSAVSPSQIEFSNAMYGDECRRTEAPNTFEVGFLIPNNQASGEYQLSQIGAVDDEDRISVSYTESELPAKAVRVENPRTLAAKPNLKGVQVR